jgi:hypothetical protein
MGFCNGLYRTPVARRAEIVGVEDQSHPAKMRRHFLEKLHQLAGQRHFVKHEPGQIAAGAREAFDQTQSDRVRRRDEDNRNLAGRLPQRIQGADPIDQDHVRLRAHQVRRGGANVIDVATAPSHVDLDVAGIRPAELLELPPKPHQPRLSLQVTAGAHQNADSPRALLRPRRERPCRRRTAEQGYHLASSNVGHGLPPRNPPCQHTARQGCPRKVTGRSLGQA